jgi:hypothetical protein
VLHSIRQCPVSCGSHLDLIEGPWRLIEHSLADPSPHDERRHAGGRGSLPHGSHQLDLAHSTNASRNKTTLVAAGERLKAVLTT